MQDPVVLHVLVVGFHHKKGCQVEFAFPPLCPDAPEAQGLELPELWKHLPSLALPDGAHNYQKDTIYFHLPSLEGPKETVYGVSCFRQISAECLKNKSKDITRGSVQKSVCVLSTLPLYGLIQTKLELITHAYFEERDFSQVTLLEETYRHLNATLSPQQVWGSQLFLGLSVRDLILQFKHKVLILFKLFLLERRVLFYKSPVKDLCTTILTVCSLFPGMLERGLCESTSAFGIKQSASEVNENILDTDCIEVSFLNEKEDTGSVTSHLNGTSSLHQDILQTSRTSTDNHTVSDKCNLDMQFGDVYHSLDKKVLEEKDSNCTVFRVLDSPDDKSCTLGGGDCEPKPILVNSRVNSSCGKLGSGDYNLNVGVPVSIEDQLLKELDEVLPNGTEGKCRNEDSNAEYGDDSKDELASLPSSSSLVTLDLESCGLPLAVFSKGSVCLPYLSLPFIECLSGLNVRGCVVGATNVLFKQKRNLFDVIVEVDGAKIEVFDLELSKQLNLTMEDLRFAENLVQHVTGEQKDVFLDGTGWEGGDEWLRAQFRLYLLSLLRTADANAGGRDQEAFNQSFVQAWQETHNFKVWQSCRGNYLGLLQTEAKHPYQKAQITMADMKLKLSHSIQSTEKGRKINQAVTSTGKAVMQTGRVVGGALTSARSFVSSWLSSVNPPNAQQQVQQETSPTDERSTEVEMKVIRTDNYNTEME